MRSFLALPSALLCLCATFTQAEYNIDDTNNTIKYLPSIGTGMQWHVSAAPEIQVNKSYAGTTTIGECNTGQGCHMQIPFTGSGITIYIVEVNFAAVNVSITVDGKTDSPTVRTFGEPKFYAHNTTLFDIQSLPSGSHTVDIALLDYNYNGTEASFYTNGTSALAFDYATINEQQVSGTASPVTSTPSPSSNDSSSIKKKSLPTGAIAGGVIGGLLAIGAVILISIILWRRSKAHHLGALTRRATEIDPDPRFSAFARNTSTRRDPPPDPYLPPGSHQHSQPAAYSSQSGATHPWTPSTFAPDSLYHPVNTTSPPPSQHGRGYSMASGDSAPTQPASIPDMRQNVVSSSISSAPSGVTSTSPYAVINGESTSPLPTKQQFAPSPSKTQTSNQLTPEQLDFVHGLYSMNVPAAEIAGIMERMRLEGSGAGSSVGTGVIASGGPALGDIKAAQLEGLPKYEPKDG